MSMKFFAIPNLSSHDVEVVDPTTSDLRAPLHSSKEERRAWQGAVTTKHLFYSACEGLFPILRVVSERNEPYRLHGLVCDYDSGVSDAELGAFAKNAAPGLLPTWTSHTFSGGARLVFEFEKPIYVDNPDLAIEAVAARVKGDASRTDCSVGSPDGLGTGSLSQATGPQDHRAARRKDSSRMANCLEI
jgi:hypothetical protein